MTEQFIENEYSGSALVSKIHGAQMLFFHIKIKEHIANAQSSVKFINIILTKWAYPIYVSHLYVHFWPLSTVAFELLAAYSWCQAAS